MWSEQGLCQSAAIFFFFFFFPPLIPVDGPFVWWNFTWWIIQSAKHFGPVSPVGIFDWENWGWFASDSLGAGGLRRAPGGVIGGRCPPSPLFALGRGGPAVAARPSKPPRRSSSVRPYQASVEARCHAAPQRESDAGESVWAAFLPSARASVSRSCRGNLSVDLPGAECKSSPEEMRRGVSACQLCVCVYVCLCVCLAQQYFL